ncbi:MAG: DUF2274 domain-containing protein [Sphingopyxis solisilvae]|uniref:DUF2274 domain-containing protein n=1 Tax=Sphingopyxis solisilvae TaxID=1886788 RepID=UPI0040355684
MSALRLGPIPEEKPVKLTIELPGRLHRDLLAYAQVHAKATGLAEPLAPERIAVPMIERFMATDRGFAAARRQS